MLFDEGYILLSLQLRNSAREYMHGSSFTCLPVLRVLTGTRFFLIPNDESICIRRG